MDPNLLDVKPASSPGGVNPGSPPADDLAKATAEIERMKGALSSLQSERNEIREKLERFEKIEEERELSAREEAERKRLERRGGSVEEHIESWRKELLRKNPDAENWFTDMELKLAKATNTATTQGANQATLERAADLLEELADDLSEKEEFKDMTDEKLLKLLRPFMREFEGKSPYLKTKKAFKKFMATQAEKAEKARFEKEKAELAASRENGNRIPRSDNLKDAIANNDRRSQREFLGIMHKQK